MEDRYISYLRDKLRDYYGTAMTSEFPMAMVELNEINSMSEEEVLKK